MNANTLNEWLEEGVIRPVDWAFAQFIAPRAGHHEALIARLAALLSYRLGQQDTCLELSRLDPVVLAGLTAVPDDLASVLNASAVVHDADQSSHEDGSKPLVLCRGRLYLQRYWHYERKLLAQIVRLCDATLDLDPQAVDSWCHTLFGATGETPDWQRVAVCLAARQKLALITGGPGTGKTTTVTRLLAMRQGIALARGKALNIALIAPTGKAAARLSESISTAKQRLPVELQAHIPDVCSTIHRLLGTVPGSQQFRFKETNPLHLDMLVVDEVSMVDLPLMSKLFAALPEHAQIILLGDKDQLASVEAGSVLSDMTSAALGEANQAAFSPPMRAWLQATGNTLPEPEAHAESPRPLADNLVVLQKSHRFSARSDIGQLAMSIHHGDSRSAVARLQNVNHPHVSLASQADHKALVAAVLPGLIKVVEALKQGQLETAFDVLMQQQILCAQRVGDWGVDALNTLLEQALAQAGMIDSSAEFYVGRPVMLSQNDHNQRLYNGDIGLVMADPAQPDLLKVWFPQPEGGFRGLIPNRLPAHETLYAMTIHKSQGSEFAHVYLCLPPARHGITPRGLSRELIYTGLTRAREHFVLYADLALVRQVIGQRCARNSGLTDALQATFPA